MTLSHYWRSAFGERGRSVSEISQITSSLAGNGQKGCKALGGSWGFGPYAGAVALPSVVEKHLRSAGTATDAKEAIARLAASTIANGQSIMVDTGTTTSYFAGTAEHRRLTVVTNSSDMARTLATVNGNKVYMAGGELRSDNGLPLAFPR